MTPAGQIRPLERRDLAELVDLCREHAAFERATWVEGERVQNLERLLLDSDLAFAWVIEGDDELAGFATARRELSTWDAALYLHLDCLYLREAYRGRGWGQILIRKAAETALESGAVNLQWQTPTWNHDAIRFYERLGAAGKEKLRFTLDRDDCARVVGTQ